MNHKNKLKKVCKKPNFFQLLAYNKVTPKNNHDKKQ